jgi:protein TonB
MAMKRGLIVSCILHTVVFFAVLLAPRSSSKWDRVDAIPVDLVGKLAPAKSDAGKTEAPAPAKEPEPPKAEVKEEPKKEAPAPKPAKRKPTRRFQKIGSTSQDEPTLEERLRARFEAEEGETTEEPQEETVTPAETQSESSESVAGVAEVEATDFPYAWYLNLLRTKIAEAWDPPASRLVAGRANQVIIRFYLSRDGTASEVEVEASGAPGLESSARRALRDAQPFPPLPQGYPEDSVVISVRFTVSEGKP